MLQEIDHKLQTWSGADSTEVEHIHLRSEDNPTIKLFGRRLRMSTLLIIPFFGFFCGLAWPIWFVYLAWHNQIPLETPMLSWWVRNFWLPFLIFPVLWIFLIFAIPRDWIPHAIRRLRAGR